MQLNTEMLTDGTVNVTNDAGLLVGTIKPCAYGSGPRHWVVKVYPTQGWDTMWVRSMKAGEYLILAAAEEAAATV